MAHTVHTPVFDGPIDLLLHLISTHAVDVLDVPLAPVVDEFVAHIGGLVEGQEPVPLDVVSEFLLIAAILVEAKSKSLLPGPDELEEDEELVGWEERDLLLARLLECRAYAAAADVLVAMTERAARSVPREAGFDEDMIVKAPDLLEGVRPEDLAQALLRVSLETPVPDVDLSHVTVDTVTVSETVTSLVEVLERRGRTTFRDLTAHLESRIAVIVHFLAVLELCKLGKVSLGQGETFGDLQIEWIAENGSVAGAAIGDLVSDEYEG